MSRALGDCLIREKLYEIQGKKLGQIAMFVHFGTKLLHEKLHGSGRHVLVFSTFLRMKHYQISSNVLCAVSDHVFHRLIMRSDLHTFREFIAALTIPIRTIQSEQLERHALPDDFAIITTSGFFTVRMVQIEVEKT